MAGWNRPNAANQPAAKKGGTKSPSVMKGEIVYVNCQKRGTTASIKASVDSLKKEMRFNVTLKENGTFDFKKPKVEGNATLFIVDDENLLVLLADGGTIRQYGKRLVQRQESEISYYHRAKTALDQAVAAKKGQAELAALLEKHNAALRRIGVKLIPMPE